MASALRAVGLLVSLAILLGLSEAVMFDIPGSGRKCLGEEVTEKQEVSISYSIIGDFSGRTGVAFYITNPSGKVMTHVDDVDPQQDLKNVRFEADSDGRVTSCFVNKDRTKKRGELIIKTGVEARDYDSVAKKQHLKPVEAELLKMEDAVAEIQTEMMYLRMREQAMRDMNESTNSRVLWFSLFSIVILIGMGAWQVYYLRNFFRSKKLI